ncbi:MAG: substrate-binding domain-containing protein [Planctomycetota bacterium]
MSDAPEKKYEQVAEIIRERIKAGSYASGSLPGLRSLASELGVNYLTVRQGLHTLCEKKVLRVSGNRNFEIVDPKRVAQRSISMLMPIGSAENAFVGAIRFAAEEQGVTLRRQTYCDYHDKVIADVIDSDSDLIFFFIDPQHLTPLFLEKIEQNRHKLVSLTFDYSKQGVVMLDEAMPAKSSRLLIDHVVSLGHKKLDIFDVTHHNEVFNRRLQCLRVLAEEQSLSIDVFSGLVPEFSQEYELSAETARRIYKNAAPPDAICALTVPSAIGIQRGLKDIGITTGEDCTLVSFEDLVLAQYSIPSITVAHTRDFLGAVRELVNAFFKPDEKPHPRYTAEASIFLGESSRA